jgi:hypothetical protein
MFQPRNVAYCTWKRLPALYIFLGLRIDSDRMYLMIMFSFIYWMNELHPYYIYMYICLFSTPLIVNRLS